MALADARFRALVIGVGLLLFLLLIRVRFYRDFELPEKPARPAAKVSDAKSVAKSLSGSTDAYKNFIEKDAANFGIARASAQTMSSVFPYQLDEEPKTLAVGDRIEVLGLGLTLSEEKIKGSKRSHMVLRIENLGHKPLAYQIQTRPSAGVRSCSKMSQLPHNALAIAAGAVEKRAECLFRNDSQLEILKIETIGLPELGFHYLSAVSPDILGLDARTGRLHAPSSDAMPCAVLQSSSMQSAVLRGDFAWRDQADFYARHRCKTYSFPPTYKAFQRDGEQILPFLGGDL